MDPRVLSDLQHNLFKTIALPSHSEEEMLERVIGWIEQAKKEFDWRVGSYAIKAAKEGGLAGCFDIMDLLLLRVRDRNLHTSGTQLLKELTQYPIAADECPADSKTAICLVEGKRETVLMGPNSDIASLVGYIEFAYGRRIFKATQAGAEVDYNAPLKVDAPIYFSFEKKRRDDNNQNPSKSFSPRDRLPPRGRGKPQRKYTAPNRLAQSSNTNNTTTTTTNTVNDIKGEWQPT
eukprot:TRINITY_DN3494_c0_g1_i1.p1 TRINITY_DN3494_c0_g1~~TRINITY_DN3494_c0_g1_i1.p1  ORF type:complete len:234 (+),score=44.59 TRINITY_DN3494_c0_g1_i1:40-741(+)